MNAGLDILEPRSRAVCLGDGEVRVAALTLGQMLAVQRALEGIDLSKGFARDEVVQLLVTHGEKFLNAIAAAVSIDRSRLESAPADHVLDLFEALIEENTDFFVRRLTPKLLGLMQRLARIGSQAGAGPTPSTRSSAPATS